MDINLLIKLKKIETEIEYIKNIKSNLYYKMYLKNLKIELKELKNKIKLECSKDGHDFEIVHFNESGFKQKCKICGFIQKNKHY